MPFNFDNFMSIPGDDDEFKEPDSIEKGKKRMKGIQREEDIAIFKEKITEINNRRENDY